MTFEERLAIEELAENSRQNYDKAMQTSCSLASVANFLGEFVAYQTVLETLENLNKEDS